MGSSVVLTTTLRVKVKTTGGESERLKSWTVKGTRVVNQAGVADNTVRQFLTVGSPSGSSDEAQLEDLKFLLLWNTDTTQELVVIIEDSTAAIQSVLYLPPGKPFLITTKRMATNNISTPSELVLKKVSLACRAASQTCQFRMVGVG